MAFLSKGERCPTSTRGLTMMTVAAVLAPFPDALTKILTEDFGITVVGIALTRFGLQSITMFPLILALNGRKALIVKNPGLNFLRGVLLAVASIAFFGALKIMPLADAVAIFFIQPVIGVLLGIIILREKPTRNCIVAISAGLCGTILIIRPNFIAAGILAILPIICALCFTVYLILGKYLSKENSSLIVHFHTGLGAAVFIGLGILIENLTMPSEIQLSAYLNSPTWFYLALIGLSSSLIHLLYIMAYRLAPVSMLAPISYIEIVSATGFGIIFFAHIPDPLQILGMVIIAASGLILLWTD
jgi:drug/metabolite transporter (DMT)-like permease